MMTQRGAWIKSLCARDLEHMSPRAMARGLPRWPAMNHRTLLAAGAAALSGAALYAVIVEPRWLQVRRTLIHVAALPPALEGLRIGLLTDLHVDGIRSARLTDRAVRVLMRYRPDMITLTGDFAEHAAGQRDVLDRLAALSAPLGVHAVPGNHDHKAGIRAWHEAVDTHPRITDLTNRYVLRERGGARICIAGVDDFHEGAPRMMLPPAATRDLTVLLAHSPDQAERCRRCYDAVDLIVSGHTHGGQVRLPGLGAPVNSAENADLYEQGLRRRPWTQVYTSRGIGTSRLPIRFLARPEIALLDLTSAPRPAWSDGAAAGPPSPARAY